MVDTWRARAECRNFDPELFFPIGMSSKADLAQLREAQAVCGHCQVQTDCLSWALDHGEAHGVWGGVDEEELRRMQRRRRKKQLSVHASGR